MASYKVEALWDCIYCHQKGVRGGLAVCPNCGHPRGAEVRFYLPEKSSIKQAIDTTKVKVSQFPDWLCVYCKAYNSANDINCKQCGAKRGKDNPDYSDFQC